MSEKYGEGGREGGRGKIIERVRDKMENVRGGGGGRKTREREREKGWINKRWREWV